MYKPALLLVVLNSCLCWLHAQAPILKEDFEKNTQNVTSLTIKSLSSGDWNFYYTDKNYNSITECAVLNYSGSEMEYIITPKLTKPSVVNFSARTIGNVENMLEIQTSVNGGSFTTVEEIMVSGTIDKQYTIPINERSDDVRIRFLRTQQSSDGSNYNIILDNIQVLGPAPTLNITNHNSLIDNGQIVSLPISGDATNIEFPLTLTNIGNEVLELSKIEAFGVCDIIGQETASLAPGSSICVFVHFNSFSQTNMNGLVFIHSNTSGCSAHLIRFEIKNNTFTH